MTKKNLIIIDGLNGAGKSTVARMLVSILKRTALISYDTIKRLIGDFTPNEEYHRIANHVVRAMAKEYFDNYVNVIIESYVPTKEIARIYTGLARRKDVRLSYFQLEAPLKVRYKRILQRPLVAGAKKMSMEQVAKNDTVYFQNRFAKATIIETSSLKPEQIAKIILQKINR